LKKFDHARADYVQAKYPIVEDVEYDRSILAVC
jgi:hypothetical protein